MEQAILEAKTEELQEQEAVTPALGQGIDEWDAELKGKKRLFVLFYCTEEECFLNGTKAYLKAYKTCESENSAAVNASKLLRNAKVKIAVKNSCGLQEMRTMSKRFTGFLKPMKG